MVSDMEQELTWKDCIIAINQLMDTLKRKMSEEPERGEFWQQELAVAMAKRQEILMLAKQQEDQQFMQSLEKICDNVLKRARSNNNE